MVDPKTCFQALRVQVCNTADQRDHTQHNAHHSHINGLASVHISRALLPMSSSTSSRISTPRTQSSDSRAMTPTQTKVLRKLDDSTSKWSACATDFYTVDPWRAARQANRALHREMGRPWATPTSGKMPLEDLRRSDRLAPLAFEPTLAHEARPPMMPAGKHANLRAAALLRAQQAAHTDPAGIRRRLTFDAAAGSVSNAAGAA